MINIAALTFQPESGLFLDNARMIIEMISKKDVPSLVFCPKGLISGAPLTRSNGFEGYLDEALNWLHKEASKLKAEILLPLDAGVIQLGIGVSEPRYVIDSKIFTHLGIKVNLSDSARVGEIYWKFSNLVDVGLARKGVKENSPFTAGSLLVSTNLFGEAQGNVYVGGASIKSSEAVVSLAKMTEGVVSAFVVRDGESLKLTSTDVKEEKPDSEFTLIYKALTLALANYVKKAGATGVVIGLSGGIDSALSAALAVDALGADKVFGIALASRYTSLESRSLVKKLTVNLGIPYREVSIDKIHQTFLEDVQKIVGKNLETSITDQNIQARLRGMWLMALANERSALMLCNANKSECAMGYGTLYGDIAGGIAPLADLWKSEVWKLAREVNKIHKKTIIPEEIIEREPTAELYPGQKDTDTLPPYLEMEQVLKKIFSTSDLKTLNEQEKALLKKFMMNSFKRAQSPMAIVVSDMPLSRLDALWGINRKF